MSDLSDPTDQSMTPATSEESVNVPDPSGEAEKPKRLPSYQVLISRAINALKGKSGSSKRAILRHILANNENINKAKASEALDRNLKQMVKKGRLVKSGTGGYKMSPRGHMAKIRQRRENHQKNLQEKKKMKKRKALMRKKNLALQKSSITKSKRKKSTKGVKKVSHRKNKILGKMRASKSKKSNQKSRERKKKELF